MSDVGTAPAQPAATVMFLRDRPEGCEVLLVRRSEQLSFHGGAWVFPGGRIDAGDYPDTAPGDLPAAARLAAVREAAEEVALFVAPEALVLAARWVSPPELPQRFDAWFFAAPAGAGVVRVDGREIQAHRWVRPADALAAQRAGELVLPPPTFVMLAQLGAFVDVAAALAALAARPVETYAPRLCAGTAGPCTVYAADAAYEDGDADRPGPRHRLWLLDSGWVYERRA